MFDVVTIDASGDANRAYCILEREARRALCVDPSFAGSAILDAASEAGCSLTDVFLTHTHYDHVATLAPLKRKPGVRVWVHPNEAGRVDAPSLLPGEGPLGAVPGVEVIYTPGHTPACVSYRIGDAVFVGDTLFMPDYGTARADFPGGDAHALYRSIRRLLTLPPETRLFMCHDYKAPGREAYAWESTVGEERARNVQIRDGIGEDAFVAARKARDKALAPPLLLLPSIQANIRAGNLPPAEENGVRYLKIPVRL